MRTKFSKKKTLCSSSRGLQGERCFSNGTKLAQRVRDLGSEAALIKVTGQKKHIRVALMLTLKKWEINVRMLRSLLFVVNSVKLGLGFGQ